MTTQEAMLHALQKYPDCKYATWENGLDAMFNITIVVNLWRNEECYLAGDPPRYSIGGYSRS